MNDRKGKKVPLRMKRTFWVKVHEMFLLIQRLYRTAKYLNAYGGTKKTAALEVIENKSTILLLDIYLLYLIIE